MKGRERKGEEVTRKGRRRLKNKARGRGWVDGHLTHRMSCTNTSTLTFCAVVSLIRFEPTPSAAAKTVALLYHRYPPDLYHQDVYKAHIWHCVVMRKQIAYHQVHDLLFS